MQEKYLIINPEMKVWKALSLFILISMLVLAGCSPPGGAAPETPVGPAQPAAASATPQPSQTETATPEPSQTATQTFTPQPSETPSPSPTPVPTYLVLRGKVTVDQAVCHYGPGAPYLYKYAVIGGSNLEVISRIEGDQYLEVQAIGGDNPCWVNAKYMQLQGELASLKPVKAEEVTLPASPYYAPPASVSAQRQGDQVTVIWTPLVLRAGDDSEQTPYILETWLCQDGKVTFNPLGTYQTALQMTDEPGCSEPSQARLLAAEKHGYTRPLEVEWPPAAP